ncbi:MAG: hypothetical protein HDS29_01065 [Bacteroides sp.]|nr:hypothetical protein [Bacteroides sp.]
MKKNILYILMMVVMLASCKDDGEVTIHSLNTFGNKVSRNDKVKVFVSVETSDELETTYSWGCDGGNFTNYDGLFQNVWVAPNEPGEYELWVTVKCDGKKETRRAKMTVTDELYFRDFETPYYNDGYTANSMTVAQSNGTARLTSSNANGRWRIVWINKLAEDVKIPHSQQITYKWDTVDKTNDQFRQRFKFNNTNKDYVYLDYVQFETRFTTGEGAWTIQAYNSNRGGTVSTTVAVPGTPVKLAKNVNAIGAMSIDANWNAYYYVDGQLISQIDLNPILANLGVTNYTNVTVQESMVSMANKLRVYLDDWCNLDNGTILTGEPIVR